MHNRNVAAADVYRDDNHMAAKLMLKAGRAKELAATYDGPVGLLSLRPNEPVRADQLHEAAVVALALRQAGRAADADRLLAQAASTIATVYRQQAIPFALDADVAAIWAVQGRRDQALSMLERAMRRGWTHSDNTDLPDIADEPAFARCAASRVSSASGRGLPRTSRANAQRPCSCGSDRGEGGQTVRQWPALFAVTRILCACAARGGLRLRRAAPAEAQGRGLTKRSRCRGTERDKRAGRHRCHRAAPAGTPSANAGVGRRSDGEGS